MGPYITAGIIGALLGAFDKGGKRKKFAKGGKVDGEDLLKKYREVTEQGGYMNCELFCILMKDGRSFKKFDKLPYISVDMLQAGDILQFGDEEIPRHFAIYLDGDTVLEVETWGGTPRKHTISDNLDYYEEISAVYRDSGSEFAKGGEVDIPKDISIPEILRIFRHLARKPEDIEVYRINDKELGFEVRYYSDSILKYAGVLQDMGIFADAHRLGDTDEMGSDIFVNLQPLIDKHRGKMAHGGRLSEFDAIKRNDIIRSVYTTKGDVLEKVRNELGKIGMKIVEEKSEPGYDFINNQLDYEIWIEPDKEISDVESEAIRRFFKKIDSTANTRNFGDTMEIKFSLLNYAKGGHTPKSDHDRIQGLKKGDKIRITRLTDNRRTETPILLTLMRKGLVNKGKRNEKTKFRFEDEDGRTFFAYHVKGEPARFALDDSAIIVSDDIDFVPKMAYGGRVTERGIKQAYEQQVLMDYGYEMTRPYFKESRGEYVGQFYVISPDGIDPYKLADALVENGMEDYTVTDTGGERDIWEIEVVIRGASDYAKGGRVHGNKSLIGLTGEDLADALSKELGVLVRPKGIDYTHYDPTTTLMDIYPDSPPEDKDSPYTDSTSLRCSQNIYLSVSPQSGSIQDVYIKAMDRVTIDLDYGVQSYSTRCAGMKSIDFRDNDKYHRATFPLRQIQGFIKEMQLERKRDSKAMADYYKNVQPTHWMD